VFFLVAPLLRQRHTKPMMLLVVQVDMARVQARMAALRAKLAAK
jgi:hypothetical protein